MKTSKNAVACLFALWLSFSLSAFAGNDGRVLYDLGVFALDEGNYVAAEKYFRDALEQEPDNPYYLHLLGKTYLNSQRPEDAIQPLETAWKLNPKITLLQFDLAMAYYDAGRYVKAEGIFSDLVAQDQNNVLARYYQGMSYFKQDRYGQALPLLLRSGEENESIRDNSYYFAGISHYKYDEPQKAQEKLEYVESSDASENLRQSARQWLEVIRSREAQSARYNLYLKLGLKYDDNVRLDPVNEDLYSDNEDFVATAYFSGKYKFVNTFSRKLGVGYAYYQTLHQDLTDFDLTAGVASLFYLERFTRELYAGLQYYPAFYWLDHDKYLRRHQVRPTLLWRQKEGKGLRLSYDFMDNHYYTEGGRSGQSYDFNLDFFTVLFNNKGDLEVGVSYGHNDSDHPDYEYNRVLGRCDFSYALPKDYKLVLNGYWDHKEYDNVDSASVIKREDDKISIGLELSRPLFYKWLKVQADYRYTKNDSNINFYSYNKNVTGLSLIAKF